jgi:hypothetical protein
LFDSHPANLIRLIITFTPIYWRRHFISANTIGFGDREALPKIRNALPIRQDIAYYCNFAGMGRKGNKDKEFYRQTTRSNSK